jgi:hypothetical protein
VKEPPAFFLTFIESMYIPVNTSIVNRWLANWEEGCRE